MLKHKTTTADASSRPVLRTFTILGERASGTHFLQHAMLKNFTLDYVRGEKHFFGFQPLVPKDEELVMIIVREPVAWVNSFFQNPFHVPDTNLGSPRDFVTREWFSTYNFEGQDGSEILQDRDMHTGQRYKNLLEMRRVKYRFLLDKVFAASKHVCVLRYEDLSQDYDVVLTHIQDVFHLQRRFDVIPGFLRVPYYKGDYSTPYTKERAITLPDDVIFHIYTNTDTGLEHGVFLYERPRCILVTGGTGLVGSAIREYYDDNKNHPSASSSKMIFLSSKDCDLTSAEATTECFRFFRPDVLLHLACHCGGLYKNMNRSIDMFEDNLRINLNTIRVAHQTGIRNLVACLSTCIFPDRAPVPMTETCLHDGPPHESNAGYAHAKRMLAVHCELYRKGFPGERNYVCVSPTNLFGPYDNFHVHDAHVIPALIHKAWTAVSSCSTDDDDTKKVLVVRGKGTAKRQFLYSRDLAKILVRVCTTLSSSSSITWPGHVIISPTEEHTISDVAEMIAAHLGITVEYDDSFQEGQDQKRVDNSLLWKSLSSLSPVSAHGTTPLFTDFGTALQETIDWFSENAATWSRK